MAKSKSVVISIRLDEETLQAVDLLVESGLESNRSRAVSHFVRAGLLASNELLGKARTLADDVHRLRQDMLDAVKGNRLDQVAELLQKDPSLANAGNGAGETAVLLSAYYRAGEIRELLLASGAELTIFEAAAVGAAARVKELLEGQPSLIAAHSPDGYTLLGLAAHFGHEETAKLLLERGADVNARSVEGNLDNMAIHAAIAGNYESIVRLLIEHGADVNARCAGKWRPGFGALHVAAYFGRTAIIPLLLENGADRRATNEKGETPQQVAAARGHAEAAELLR